MDWFKTKENTEEAPVLADEVLLPLVRTMSDDLIGREVPTKVTPKAEPLAGFDPKAPSGAAFYAAPGVVTSESVGGTPETSPFFHGEEENDTAKEGVTENPASQGVKPLNSVESSLAAPPTEPPVVPSSSIEEERKLPDGARPVAFSVPASTPGASFEGVLPTGRQTLGRLKSIFTQEKAKWLFLAGAGIILILVGGGVYAWRISQNKADIPNEIKNSPLIPTPDQPVQPEPVSQKQYQVDQPNILSFDTETVTPVDIKNALLQAGQGIKKDGLTGAVEFIVRDQKLNPLALSRFAYLAKIELPSSLLEILDESFSIYVYIDQDRPRAVLLASAKNQEALSIELQKNEKFLPGAMEPLFLDMTTAPKTNLTFRDGSYLERPVRFTNVDVGLGLSVDYAVRGKQWIIGTSKNSLRAVLDKTGL